MKFEIPEQVKGIKDIYAATSRINRCYNRWAQKQGLNHYVVDILYVLYTAGPVTQKQFVEDFNVPKQSVNNIITALKKDDHITLQTNTEDKREKIIALTGKGRNYADELLAPLFKIEEAVMQKMGRQLINRLVKANITFSGLLEQEMNAVRKMKR